MGKWRRFTSEMLLSDCAPAMRGCAQPYGGRPFLLSFAALVYLQWLRHLDSRSWLFSLESLAIHSPWGTLLCSVFVPLQLTAHFQRVEVSGQEGPGLSWCRLPLDGAAQVQRGQRGCPQRHAPLPSASGKDTEPALTGRLPAWSPSSR